MEKTKSVIEALREYVNRNSDEEDIPSGFYSADDCIKIMKCSKKQFLCLARKMIKEEMCKVLHIKRYKTRRIYSIPHYSFDPIARKLMGLK
jgi:hypothetical protein